MDYISAIEEPRAVRSYDPSRQLSKDQIETIQKAIDKAQTPFGGTVVVKLHQFELSGKQTPSTYGSVSGASWFMLVGFPEDKDSMLSAGFRQAQVALKIFSMGLGTNWMTDTFKGSQYSEVAQFPESTPLHVIMPVGYPAEKQRMVEKLTHKLLGSASRKLFDTLFFSGNFNHPVSKESPFYRPLELMRTAPSAYNKQPWRALADGDRVYFYQEPSRDSLTGMGIGLCQFYFSLVQLGFNGIWLNPDNAPVHEGWEPVTVFELKK